MQSAVPCLLMSAPRNSADREAGESVLSLKGGTDAAMAPPVSYTQQVLVPMLKRLLGVDIHVELKRRGFFPKVQLTACQSCRAGVLQPAVRQVWEGWNRLAGAVHSLPKAKGVLFLHSLRPTAQQCMSQACLVFTLHWQLSAHSLMHALTSAALCMSAGRRTRSTAGKSAPCGVCSACL